MLIFDYIFFRVAKFFYKKDGVDAFRAVCIVSVVQILLLGASFFSILRLIYNLSEISKFTHFSGKVGGAFYFLFLIFNYYRYKVKYWKFSKKWNNETLQQKKLRGIMVFGVIFLSLFLVFWLGTSGYRV